VTRFYIQLRVNAYICVKKAESNAFKCITLMICVYTRLRNRHWPCGTR